MTKSRNDTGSYIYIWGGGGGGGGASLRPLSWFSNLEFNNIQFIVSIISSALLFCDKILINILYFIPT